jgi:hypothetical protein
VAGGIVDLRGHVTEQLDLFPLPEALEIGHEEQPVAPVEQSRNPDRTAQSKPVLVPAKRRARRARFGERIGLRIQIGVPEEFEDRAVEPIAPRLGRDVNLAHLAAEFRRIHAALNLELLQSVDGGQKGVAIAFDIGVLQPIQGVAVEDGARTRDGQAGVVAAISADADVARTESVGDVRAEEHEGNDIAPI